MSFKKLTSSCFFFCVFTFCPWGDLYRCGSDVPADAPRGEDEEERGEIRENIKTISIVVLLYPGGQICLDTLQAEGQGPRLEEHLAQRGGIFKPLSYFSSITVISLITVTLPHNLIQGAWKVESERGSEGGASLVNGEEHPTIKDKEPAIQQPASNGVKNPKKPGAKKAQMAQQRTKQSQKI